MCRIIYCNLWPLWLYHTSHHYLIDMIFRKSKLLNTKCSFDFVYKSSQIFLFIRRIQRKISVKVTKHSCKVPLNSADSDETRVLQTDRQTDRQSFQKTSNLNFTKIRPVGAELYHADRRTDRHNEPIDAFRYFAKAPKNEEMYVTGSLWATHTHTHTHTHICINVP
jgi:hypothetical protein